MKIYTKQIDEASLTAFVTGVAGTSLSGQLSSYLQNGGYLGVNVVYASGGTQIVSGNKNFDSSPGVPYSGGTGTAPSRLYVDDQIALNLANANLVVSGNVANLSGNIFNTGARLSSVRVTGSSGIQTPNFSGIGGTLVVLSGNFVLISGAAGGGGSVGNGDGINLSGNLNASGRRAWDDATNISGNLNASGRRAWDDATNLSGRLFVTGANLSAISVTGSSIIQSPIFTGMNGSLIIQSGNFVLFSGGGGGGNSNVSVTGSNPIAAPNFTGAGGVLLLQSGNFVIVSGNLGSTFINANTFNITGTGTTFVTNLASGNQTNTFNVTSGVLNTNPTILNGVTGNYVNMSFYFDEFNTSTGLNLVEGFVSRNFNFTGWAVGVYVSGTQGTFSGQFYQRNTSNVKTPFAAFSLLSGQFFFGTGGFNQVISGMNRIGIDIFSLLTGATGYSVGAFGVGS